MRLIKVFLNGMGTHRLMTKGQDMILRDDSMAGVLGMELYCEMYIVTKEDYFFSYLQRFEQTKIRRK